eukprot:5874492-Alexandrium_andersonii.AAC.1
MCIRDREGCLEVEEDRHGPRMLERVPLHGALGLEDVVAHRSSIEEPLLSFRDPVLEEVAEAELDGRGQDPVVSPHNGERARVLREVVVAQ